MVLQLALRPRNLPESHSDLSYTFAPDNTLCRSGAARDVSRQALTFHSTTQILKDDEYDSDTQDCRVFTGTLSRAGSPDITVICKFAYDPFTIGRCRSEAERYQKELLDLQGHFIPTFYGFYTGEVDGYPGACILLEHCGVRPSSWDVVPMDLRVKAVETLMAIHDRGLRHNDFSTNVVVDNAEKPQRIFVIDFDNATAHVCMREKPIMLFAMAIHPVDFKCVELCQAAERLAIWTPTVVPFAGKGVSVNEAATAEMLIDGHGGWLLAQGRDFALSVAQNAIDAYWQRWGSRKDYISGEKVCYELRPAVPPSQAQEEATHELAHDIVPARNAAILELEEGVSHGLRIE